MKEIPPELLSPRGRKAGKARPILLVHSHGHQIDLSSNVTGNVSGGQGGEEQSPGSMIMKDKVIERKATDLDRMVGEKSGPFEEDMKRTSGKREWEIKKLQERYGLPREVAERIVDESRGTV